MALLPCPFCGGKAQYANSPVQGRNTMALCMSCGAEACVSHWQARTSPTVSLDEVATMLRESLFHLRLDDGAKSYHDRVCALLTRIKERQ